MASIGASGDMVTKLKIVVDPETQKITSVVTELGRVKKASQDTTAEIVKGLAVWASLTQIVRLAEDAFRDGVKEIVQMEGATLRLQTTAKRTGESFDEMRKFAESFAEDGLVKAEDAMKQLSDLMQSGFNLGQAEQMMGIFKDLASSIGGNVTENMNLLTDAIVKGRFAGAELVRMLPSLKENLKAAGLTMKDMADETKANEVRQVLINSVLKDGTAALGAHKEMLASVGGQMQVLSNFSDELKRTFADGVIAGFKEGSISSEELRKNMLVLLPAIEAIGKAIGTLIGWLTQLPHYVKDAATAWGTWADELYRFTIGNFLNDSGKGMSLLTEKSKQLTAGMNIGRSAVTQYGQSVDLWSAAAAKAGVNLSALTAKTVPNTKATKDSAAEAEKAKKAFDEWGASIEKIGQQSMADLIKNLDLLKTAETLALETTLQFQQAVHGVSDILSGTVDVSMKDLKDNLDLLAPGFGDMKDYILNDYGKPMKDVEVVTVSLTQKIFDLANALAGIGQLFNQLASIIGGTFGKALAAIGTSIDAVGQGIAGVGQIMSGDILGGIQSLIGAFGKLFNVIKSLFGHNWGKDVANQLGLAGFAGISADLQKQIADLAKKIGDADTAVFLSLTDIANELGVTSENAAQFFGELDNGFGLMARGFITAQQMTEQLNNLFPKLATVSTDAFGLIDDNLKRLIQETKDYGLNVQAVTDFLNTQFSSLAAGVNAIAAAGITTKAEWQNLQNTFVSAFQAMIAGGMSAAEALAALNPTLQALMQSMIALGMKGSAAFRAIKDAADFQNKWKDTIAALQGVNAALVALSNTGMLTKKRFNELEHEAENMFKRFTADGHVSRQELAQMAPTLELLARLAEQYGFKLDPAIQKLIDMAKKQGLIKDTGQGATDPMVASINKLVDAFTGPGGLIPTIKDFIATLGQIPSTVGTTVTVTYSDQGLTGGGGKGIPRMATLTDPITFMGPTHIIVDRGETLLPSYENSRSTSTTARRGERPININIFGGDPMRLRDAIRQLERDGEL